MIIKVDEDKLSLSTCQTLINLNDLATCWWLPNVRFFLLLFCPLAHPYETRVQNPFVIYFKRKCVFKLLFFIYSALYVLTEFWPLKYSAF